LSSTVAYNTIRHTSPSIIWSQPYDERGSIVSVQILVSKLSSIGFDSANKPIEVDIEDDGILGPISIWHIEDKTIVGTKWEIIEETYRSRNDVTPHSVKINAFRSISGYSYSPLRISFHFTGGIWG